MTTEHNQPRRAGLFAAFLAALLLLCANPAAAQLHKGEKSFGPRIGYVSRNHSVLAGLSFTLATATHVRLAPEAVIIFRHHNSDALGIAMNVQFPFAFEQSKFAAYPLVGIEYVSWGLHGIDPESAKDVTTHVNRFGANAGGGLELRCNSTLKLNLEARYTLVRKYSTASVSLGINYVF